MSTEKDMKSKIIDDNKQHDKDTGSPEVQVALYTQRITELTAHFQGHKQDHNSRIGLIKLVGKRKKMLEYLKRKDFSRYQNLIAKLNLRK